MSDGKETKPPEQPRNGWMLTAAPLIAASAALIKAVADLVRAFWP